MSYSRNTQKYHNTIVDTDDGRFDSKKEYARWIQLKELEKSGEIQNLVRQTRWNLIPAQSLNTPVVSNGKLKKIERKVDYVADFAYEKDGKVIIEDVKGMKKRTPEYIIKRKLMLYKYGLQIVEV